jgi:glycosyltransferase involved in cell wall biosynthesis
MSQLESAVVSVIIPNFNYAHYLEETVNSVLTQTHPNVEIIVVDDGSTDNSLEVLSQLSKKVVVVQSENNGSCIARNLGMSKATGQYIAYLDADDTWDPEKIERQLMRLKESKADLIFCHMRTYGEDVKSISDVKEFVVEHDWFLLNPGATPFSPSCVLLTRELAFKVGGWNTSLTGPAEDFDYFRKCAKFGRIVSLNEILVSHRQHPGSLTAANARRYFEDNRRVLKIMFDEDRSKLNLTTRVRLWVKFHLNFLKHSLKAKNIRLCFLISISFIQY